MMRDLGLLELVLRLGVGAGAALLLGLEREIRGHDAGTRTHALVAVGAALFTVTGAYGFADMPHGPNVDPARIAAQVASGVGFLGAGAILRQGLGVRGLTTAATLWLAAALGVASGAGAYAAVGIGTAVVLLALVALRMAEPWVARWSGATTTIDLEYRRGHGTLGPVLRSVSALGGQLHDLEITDEGDVDEAGLRHVSIRLRTTDTDRLLSLVDDLRARPEVSVVRVTGGSTLAA